MIFIRRMLFNLSTIKIDRLLKVPLGVIDKWVITEYVSIIQYNHNKNSAVNVQRRYTHVTENFFYLESQKYVQPSYERKTISKIVTGTLCIMFLRKRQKGKPIDCLFINKKALAIHSKIDDKSKHDASGHWLYQ